MTDNSTNSDLLTTIVHENDSNKDVEGQLKFILVPIGVLFAVMILTFMVRQICLSSYNVITVKNCRFI